MGYDYYREIQQQVQQPQAQVTFDPIQVVKDIVTAPLRLIDNITGIVPEIIMPGNTNVTPGDSLAGRAITGITDGITNLLPQNNITASPSIADTQSIQPVLENEGLSLEEVFSQPLQLGEDTGTMGLQDAFSAPIDTGTQGLFEAFSDGGGGFIPPEFTSEAQMVELGIGDGWTPNTIYETETKTLSGMGGAGSGGGRIRVTPYANDNYGVYMENYETGQIETFIQKGTTGQEGINNYENNFVRSESNMTAPPARNTGIDISGLIGASVADPSATLQKSTQPITVQQFYSSAPLPGMERIDTLNDADLVSEIDIRELPGMTNSQGNDPFSQRVLDTIDIIESNATGEEIASNPYVQELKDGKSFEEVFGILPGINDEEVVVNDLSDPIDDNSTMGLENAFSTGGLADGNQTGLYSTPTQRYLEDENVFDTKADEFMSERNRNPQYKEIFGKPADEAIADMVSLGISKETATKIINKRDASTGNKQPMQFTDDPSTTTNNINPDNNQTGINLAFEIPDISKNVATGIGTSTVDGNEFEFVYDPSKVDPTVSGAPSESQLQSALSLLSDESFREFDDSLRVSTAKNPISDSAGSNDQGYDLDLFDKSRADFIDVFEKSGATIDQINDLKQQVNKIDLMGKAKNILPTLNPNNFIGTIQSVLKVPERFKLFQNSTDAHNIRQSQIKNLRPIQEDLAKAAGRKYEDMKDILNMELTLPQLITEVENIIDQVEASGIDADLTSTEELLSELQSADLYGKDVAILKDSDYNSIYSNSNLDSTIDGLDDVGLSKDDYVKVYNHKGEEVSNKNIYSEETKREPQTWGVINEDGSAVAKWNPFEPESRQERDMRNRINPNRGFGDGTGLDPVMYPDQANAGYSSPTMATIDRNIRPTLDRVGDLAEWLPELAGMGMYNTVGRLPVIGGLGKSAGNALAKVGQGIDRAIDTKIPDAIFGLKTGDDGDGNDSKMSKEEMEMLRGWTESSGISPLTELMRDKHLYGMYGSGSPGPENSYASSMLNSTSSPGMSIYGGTGAPGMASTGGPGGTGSVGGTGGSNDPFDGLNSMSGGFDLSTPEGQEKFADLYGEDRLMDELAKRGLFDRRGAGEEEEALANRDVYAGSEIADYSVKNLDEKPKPNIGKEIAEGIKDAQTEEKKGIFA